MPAEQHFKWLHGTERVGSQEQMWGIHTSPGGSETTGAGTGHGAADKGTSPASPPIVARPDSEDGQV